MVSRSIKDRQVLALQNAASVTVWIMSSVAICRAEQKEKEINTDGSVQDLQVISLFLSMCSEMQILNLEAQ